MVHTYKPRYVLEDVPSYFYLWQDVSTNFSATYYLGTYLVHIYRYPGIYIGYLGSLCYCTALQGPSVMCSSSFRHDTSIQDSRISIGPHHADRPFERAGVALMNT